ncbi:FxsB family cyclophane-forming radical SAM/SPASM peptide maturase [Streptomyces sp. NPDC051320]|uniref:FxsB family cyclophane-forming radical SAM/SPASM peptide maturase n=1 Tax=Streptomyces sp. NPDC051320 TaxID=3154644 RepID=UPI00342B1CC2
MASVKLNPSPPAAEWPLTGLDLAALEAGGWRPLPFNEFVVKLHSRCNLACDYCYIYEMADQSWHGQPTFMAEDTMATIVERIGEHAEQHRLKRVVVILHGGEPLLAGLERTEFFVGTLRSRLAGITPLTLLVQTNGVLLDQAYLEMFARNRVYVSVSLDGGREENDRHRRYRNGRGSFDDVSRGLGLLGSNRYRSLFAGMLCTVDVKNDPIRTYETLAEFAPPRIDFLLPHANWSAPPASYPGSATPHADWLLTIFDHWYGPDGGRVKVRLFEDLIALILGGHGGSEAMGTAPARMAVFETNGDLEQVDSLKSAFPGAAQLGFNVRDHALDLALRHPAIAARQIGMDALSDTCLDCSLRQICGGGQFTHRYREGTGFRNPSVYCADLQKLIETVYRKISSDLTAVKERATHATVRPAKDHR